MQARHVWSLQYRHSKIHQCGPEWHRLHVHWINVLSDLIILNECAQVLAVTAIFAHKKARTLRDGGKIGTWEWREGRWYVVGKVDVDRFPKSDGGGFGTPVSLSAGPGHYLS